MLLALMAAGCFYPPMQKPVLDDNKQITLALPFDLAWDDVHTIISKNAFPIIAEDPNNGIIESQAPGRLPYERRGLRRDAWDRTSRGSRAEPDPGSSAVYSNCSR